MNVFSGLSRPLKAAGLVLIGVAIAAAMIGAVTVLNKGDSNESANPAPASSVSPTSAPSNLPPPAPTSGSSSGSVPAPDSSVPATTTSASSSSTQPGEDKQAVAKWVTVRVLNNSTTHGLAARAADDLRDAGWNVVEVNNYSDGIIPVTTAYYRPGTDEETAAKAIAIEFGMRAEMRFEGIGQASPGVIVIVTNNYQRARGKFGG